VAQQDLLTQRQMSYAFQLMRKEQQLPTGAATIRRNLCQEGLPGSAIRWPAAPLVHSVSPECLHKMSAGVCNMNQQRCP
jgi:hypothetical protein